MSKKLNNTLALTAVSVAGLFGGCGQKYVMDGGIQPGFTVNTTSNAEQDFRDGFANTFPVAVTDTSLPGNTAMQARVQQGIYEYLRRESRAGVVEISEGMLTPARRKAWISIPDSRAENGVRFYQYVVDNYDKPSEPRKVFENPPLEALIQFAIVAGNNTRAKILDENGGLNDVSQTVLYDTGIALPGTQNTQSIKVIGFWDPQTTNIRNNFKLDVEKNGVAGEVTGTFFYLTRDMYNQSLPVAYNHYQGYSFYPVPGTWNPFRLGNGQFSSPTNAVPQTIWQAVIQENRDAQRGVNPDRGRLR